VRSTLTKRDQARGVPDSDHWAFERTKKEAALSGHTDKLGRGLQSDYGSALDIGWLRGERRWEGVDFRSGRRVKPITDNKTAEDRARTVELIKSELNFWKSSVSSATGVGVEAIFRAYRGAVFGVFGTIVLFDPSPAAERGARRAACTNSLGPNHRRCLALETLGRN
jgi:hypothetical protein